MNAGLKKVTRAGNQESRQTRQTRQTTRATRKPSIFARDVTRGGPKSRVLRHDAGPGKITRPVRARLFTHGSKIAGMYLARDSLVARAGLKKFTGRPSL